MREVPMLFNTEMVKAILDGRKTQTRRLIKGLPLIEPYATVEDGQLLISDENGEWYHAERFSKILPGDVIWVRETWCHVKFGLGEWHYEYRADCSDPRRWSNGSFAEWRPSIHMPREAARLFMKVNDVRAERLKDMSPEDCANDGGFDPEAVKAVGIAPLFGTLWDSTVKKADLPRYGWDASPWVWVIEFERMEATTWDAIRL